MEQVTGTRDGTGSADHDEPYTYRKPSTVAPFPFNTDQYARLLILRGRVADGQFVTDRVAA